MFIYIIGINITDFTNINILLFTIPMNIFLFSGLYLLILDPIIFKIKYGNSIFIYYFKYLYNLASLYFFQYDKYFFIVRKPNSEKPWKILSQHKKYFVSENFIIVKK